jgi:hypothetical protein
VRIGDFEKAASVERAQRRVQGKDDEAPEPEPEPGTVQYKIVGEGDAYIARKMIKLQSMMSDLLVLLDTLPTHRLL